MGLSKLNSEVRREKSAGEIKTSESEIRRVVEKQEFFMLTLHEPSALQRDLRETRPCLNVLCKVDKA